MSITISRFSCAVEIMGYTTLYSMASVNKLVWTEYRSWVSSTSTICSPQLRPTGPLLILWQLLRTRHKPRGGKQTGSQKLRHCKQGVPQTFVVVPVRAERGKGVRLSHQEEEHDRTMQINHVSLPAWCTFSQPQSYRGLANAFSHAS